MDEVVGSERRQRFAGRMSVQDLDRFAETYGERIPEEMTSVFGYKPVLIKPVDRFDENDIAALYGIGLRNPRILPVSREVVGYVPSERIGAILDDPSVKGVVDTSAKFEPMEGGSEEVAFA